MARFRQNVRGIWETLQHRLTADPGKACCAAIESRTGSLLLESVLAIAVIAVVAMGAARAMNGWAEDTRDTVLAGQMKGLHAAVTSYSEADAAWILANLPSGGVVQVPWSRVTASGFLDPAFSGTTAYDQTPQLFARRVGSSNEVQLLLLTTGGEALSDQRAAKVASLIGDRGGFVPYGTPSSPTTPPDLVQGSYGGWSVSESSFSSAGAAFVPGQVATLGHLSGDEVLADYLYRVEVVGRPAANQMQTDLSLGGNEITDADRVGVTTAIDLGTEELDVPDAAMVNEMFALDCAADQVVTRRSGVVSCDQAVPSGTVVLSADGTCQTGYTPYNGFDGRALVAGNPGATGGAVGWGSGTTVTIAQSNLPSFSWDVEVGGIAVNAFNGSCGASCGSSALYPSSGYTRTNTFPGGNQPIAIPEKSWAGVRLCIKS